MSHDVSRRTPRLRHEGAWAIVDQALSSATNFVPALVLARLLGPADFGTFSLVFLAWFLALSIVRSALMQPYTLGASSLGRADWRELTSRASGVVVAAGGVLGLLFGGVAWSVGPSSPLGRALLVIALLAPGLVLQEFWRVASFAATRAKTAAANDAWWALGQTVAFAILLLTTRATAAGALLAWGAGAWLAAGIGTLQLSVRPSIDRSALRWARSSVGIGAWFTGANAMFSLGLFGVAAIVAAATGRYGLGLFRVVQSILFAPVQLLTIGAESVFLPHLVRSTRRASATGLDEAVRYSTFMAGAVAIYGVLLGLIARPVLVHVFGRDFAAASTLVLPMLVVYLLDAAGSGAGVLLRARAQGRRLVSAQTAATTARLVAVALLAARYGVAGAAWGLAIGSGVGAVAFWGLASATHRGPTVVAANSAGDEEQAAVAESLLPGRA